VGVGGTQSPTKECREQKKSLGNTDLDCIINVLSRMFSAVTAFEYSFVFVRLHAFRQVTVTEFILSRSRQVQNFY
jgi:hypothetical protein